MDYYNLLLIGAAFVTAVFGGDAIVSAILSSMEKKLSAEEKSRLMKGSIQNAGRIIGYLERALVFLLGFNRQFSAIGFIIAAKSLIRFESAKDRVFAEYFIVGTFCSILIAVIAAIMVS